MSGEYDYLTVGEADGRVLRHLSEMGEQLKSSRERMLAAEAAYEAAKKEYEHYANTVLPSEMHACGVDSVSLESGGTLSVRRNFYCQPNKNDMDRRVIAEWLEAHGGGHIVERTASVAAGDTPLLDRAGVPYTDTVSFNTQRLKSFLKDGVGAVSGVQRFTADEIPACAHFQEVTTVEITV